MPTVERNLLNGMLIDDVLPRVVEVASTQLGPAAETSMVSLVDATFKEKS